MYQKKGSSVSKSSSEQPFTWNEDATCVLPTTEYDDAAADASPTRVISATDADDDATQVLPPLASEDPTVPLQPQSAHSSDDETVALPAQNTQHSVADDETVASPAHIRTPSASEDETVVLPTQNRQNFADADETVVLPAQTRQQPHVAPSYRQAPQQPSAYAAPAQSQNYAASQTPQYPYAAPRQQQAAPQAPPMNSRGLQTLRPSNIRQTRPTTWAMIQHLMTLVTFGFLLWAAVVFFVQTSVGQLLDETAFEEFSYQFLGYQDQTMKILDWIPAVTGVIAVIGLIFVLIWKHRFVPAIIGVLVAVCANGSAQILKNFVINKPVLGIQEAALNSAPSGHTTFAAAAGAALFLASPKKLRPTVALLAALFTIAAGFSTVINGWHRPADVITAIFLTGAWTVIGLMVLRFMRSEELDMSNTQRSGLILIPLSTITCFFMAFCAVALYLVNAYEPFSGATLAAASCMIISAQTFTTAMLVSLLRPQNKQRKAYTKVWTY